MQGFNVSEGGHVVPLVCPVSSSATVNGTSQWFSMKGWHHASIIMLFGAVGSAIPTGVTLNAATSAAGAGSAAMTFRYYKSIVTVSGDILAGPTVATSSGFAPANSAGAMYVIEVDSPEIESITDGNAYLQLVIAGGTSTLISALAVLSAGRFTQQASPTVLA